MWHAAPVTAEPEPPAEPHVGVRTDPGTERMRALIDEACRKSALIWLRTPGAAHARAAWHAYVDGAIHLVGGGIEQELPPLADGAEVEVTVRSKDTWGRILRLTARATRIQPGTEAWDAVVPELHAKRLNPPDGEQQPARWARESAVFRLDPVGRPHEHPGHVSHSSHAAEPVATPATTRGRLPLVLGRRARRRR